MAKLTWKAILIVAVVILSTLTTAPNAFAQEHRVFMYFEGLPANHIEPGWQGYNYLVNWPAIDEQHTSVKQSSGGWRWQEVGTARYRVEGNQLMIAVPRSLIGLADCPVSFDLHWADNIPCSGDVADFFTHGDSAPARRFDYRYEETE